MREATEALVVKVVSGATPPPNIVVVAVVVVVGKEDAEDALSGGPSCFRRCRRVVGGQTRCVGGITAACETLPLAVLRTFLLICGDELERPPSRLRVLEALCSALATCPAFPIRWSPDAALLVVVDFSAMGKRSAMPAMLEASAGSVEVVLCNAGKGEAEEEEAAPPERLLRESGLDC